MTFRAKWHVDTQIPLSTGALIKHADTISSWPWTATTEMLFWTSAILGQWCHCWVYRPNRRKTELTGRDEGPIVASISVGVAGPTENCGADKWVSSWIVFPLLEYGRNGGPMGDYSGWCVAINFKTNTGGICWRTCYLPQTRWGIYSDSTQQICSNGPHRNQLRRLLDWCWCNLQCLGCNQAQQTESSE